MATTTSAKSPEGTEILGDMTPAYAEILTPEAMVFLANLSRRFGATRLDALRRA